MELKVAKFGGTSIGNGDRIKKAAQSVVDEYNKGNQIVVVVSAVNKTTDDLLKLSNIAVSNLTDQQKANIVSMGEITSIRLFAAALESLGMKSEFIDPYNELWPIITDSNPLEARIDFKSTHKKAYNLKQLLDDGVIPVICGFLGKGPNDEITTLGRGGSDITAFLLGHCLDANEVIIVTDVDGVMTTDPNKIKNAERLDEISVEEMRDLATHGAQVLHPHALKYKDPRIKAKIISYEFGDLSVNGTTIVGPLEDKNLNYSSLYPNPISQFAVVGEGILNKSNVLFDLIQALVKENINILGIAAAQNSVTFFLDKEVLDVAYQLLHDVVIENENLSSLSLGDDVAMICLSDTDFVDTPGIISEFTEPLRENNINIVELSSSQTAITIYVDWEDGKEAHHLIKNIME